MAFGQDALRHPNNPIRLARLASWKHGCKIIELNEIELIKLNLSMNMVMQFSLVSAPASQPAAEAWTLRGRRRLRGPDFSSGTKHCVTILAQRAQPQIAIKDVNLKDRPPIHSISNRIWLLSTTTAACGMMIASPSCLCLTTASGLGTASWQLA